MNLTQYPAPPPKKKKLGVYHFDIIFEAVLLTLRSGHFVEVASVASVAMTRNDPIKEIDGKKHII